MHRLPYVPHTVRAPATPRRSTTQPPSMTPTQTRSLATPSSASRSDTTVSAHLGTTARIPPASCQYNHRVAAPQPLSPSLRTRIWPSPAIAVEVPEGQPITRVALPASRLSTYTTEMEGASQQFISRATSNSSTAPSSGPSTTSSVSSTADQRYPCEVPPGPVSSSAPQVAVTYVLKKYHVSEGRNLPFRRITSEDDPWHGDAEGFVVFKGTILGVYRTW